MAGLWWMSGVGGVVRSSIGRIRAVVMSRPQVEPGTVVAFTDVLCGWSTVAFASTSRAPPPVWTTRWCWIHSCSVFEDLK